VTIEKVDPAHSGVSGPAEDVLATLPECQPALDDERHSRLVPEAKHSDTKEPSAKTPAPTALGAEESDNHLHTKEEAVANEPHNTAKASANSKDSKVVVKEATHTVKMHCHGPAMWTDYLPKWTRREIPITDDEAADRELLNTSTYRATLSWGGLLALVMLAFAVTMMAMPDFRHATIHGAISLWRKLLPDNRTRYERWRDGLLASAHKWLTDDFYELVCQNLPFGGWVRLASTWYNYYFAPPPLIQRGRYVVALAYTTLITLVFRATDSAKRHVIYVTQGRFNATSTLEVNTHLLDLLNRDPDILPRNGIAGNEVPASLISAVRYAVQKYDTTNVSGAVLEGTIDCYLQRRMLRAAKSERYRSNVTGLPNFRR